MVSVDGLTQIKNAGIGKRFAAMLIDLWLIAVLSDALLICMRWIDGEFSIHKIFGIEDNFVVVGAFDVINGSKVLNAIGIIFTILVVFVYFSISDCSPWKASPGKRLLGLRVTTRAGRRMGKSASVYRTALFLASGLLAGVPYIAAFFSPKIQTMHDQITKSRVIEIKKLDFEKMSPDASLETPKPLGLPETSAASLAGRLKRAWGSRSNEHLTFSVAQTLEQVKSVRARTWAAMGLAFLVIASVGLALRTTFKSGQGEVRKPSLAAAGEKAMKLAIPMLRATANYNNEAGRLPEAISPPVISEKTAKGISKIEYRRTSGQIVIGLELGKDVGRSAATILFSPNFSNGKLVSWGCGAYGFEGSDRPSTCAGNLTP